MFSGTCVFPTWTEGVGKWQWKKKKAGIRIVLTYDSQVKKNKTQKTESTVTKISKNFLQKNT